MWSGTEFYSLFFLGLFFMGKVVCHVYHPEHFFYPLCLECAERDSGNHASDLTPSSADIYGGVLVGLGIGLVVRQGASTGGTGYSALIMKSSGFRWNFYVCDFTVLVMQAFFSTSDRF